MWSFFGNAGKVTNIILPKKRDKNNRRFGFVKVQSPKEINRMMDKLQYEVFYSQPLKMSLARANFQAVRGSPAKIATPKLPSRVEKKEVPKGVGGKGKDKIDSPIKMRKGGEAGNANNKTHTEKC